MATALARLTAAFDALAALQSEKRTVPPTLPESRGVGAKRSNRDSAALHGGGGGQVAAGSFRRAPDPLPAPKTGISGPYLTPENGQNAVSRGGRPRLVNCGISERKGDSDFWKWVHDSAPITGFQVLKSDVLPVRTARNPEELADRLTGAPPRGKIEFLSWESRRRLALLAANCSVTFQSLLTLTYPREFPCDGLDVKRHLHAFLAALRRKVAGVQYLWFLEFQRRGAPHFHAFLDVDLPQPLSEMHRKSGRVRKTVHVHRPWQAWASERWFSIVGSGDLRHLKAGAAWEAIEEPDGAARYVAKECHKTFQKVVPADFQNVGRFWGCSKGVFLVERETLPATAADLRAIFPAEAFREDGEPHGVIFGGAEAWEKIRDTAADPVKRRAWKRGKAQKLLNVEFSAPAASITGKSSGAILRTPARKMIRAQEEWHGSTLKG